MNRFQPVITKLIFGLMMLLSGVCLSQIDGATINTTGENPFFQPTPSSLVPENKPPVSLTIPFKDRDPKMQFPPPSQEPQQLDMTASDGLLDYIPGKSPKAFQKDKEPRPEFARDQDLGDVTTSGDFVQVKYRDHEYVDGDLIRVYVNGDIVQSSVFLGGSFSGFTLSLQPGANRIEFEAINQGSSGPNTAELHVYNEKGFIISAKEWNLLTGYKASVLVIKD
jgi:hypothetical protein